MKKIHLIILTVFLNFAMFSCSPQTIIDDVPQACCGEDGDLPPPPPNSSGNGGG